MESKLNSLVASVRLCASSYPQEPNAALQSYSMIVVITMNFFLYHKSWRHLEKCGKPRHSTSSSRMWRNSLRVIRASMSNSGNPIIPRRFLIESALKRIVRFRYFVRVSISRRIADVSKEKDIWVHSYRMPPDSNNSIKMEVGIEDCLHIEFEYNKSKYAAPSSLMLRTKNRLTVCCVRYHLKDVIVGKIYFLLVRIKIKHMELSIIRRETTGSPPNQYNESETITKFEIMDGAPVRG